MSIKRSGFNPLRIALLLMVMLLAVWVAGCEGRTAQANGPGGPDTEQAGIPADSAAGSAGSQAGSAGNAPGSSGGSKPDSPAGNVQGKPESGAASPVSSATKLGTVTAVRVIDPSSGWTGGAGWIARTDDGGGKWTVQLQSEKTVKQLFALNGKQAWAVMIPASSSGGAAAGELLQTTDGGTTWHSVGTMPNAAFVHFVTAQEGFAGSAHTVDGGKTWTTLPAPAGITGDAYFHDSKNGWAAAEEQGSVVVKRTADGGKTWANVMSRPTVSQLTGTVIRSAGPEDGWVEMVGESGMSQTSYSLFHTADGGKTWITVLANSTAGAGPAPGFPLNDNAGPKNAGSKPGDLDVVDRNTAYMGGYCPACDKPNTYGRTTDGGKTWTNGKAEYAGSLGAMLAFADAAHGWWITTDSTAPSVLYTTSDGGASWKQAHTFDRP